MSAVAGGGYQADAAARTAAQLEFERPQVVEAGAGTGKTSMLVARIVAWCLGPGWERAALALGPGAAAEPVAARVLHRVVAITFTEAAAAEMAERVARALTAVGRGERPLGVVADALPPLAVRTGRARALAAQLHRVRIRTIHSFCLRLLQAFPIEAGLDPGFTVDAGGLAVESVVRQVVEEATRRGLGDELDPDWLALVATGVTPADVVAALVALGNSWMPAAALAADPLAANQVDELAARLKSVLGAFLEAERGRLAARGLGPRTRSTREWVSGLAARVGTVEGATLDGLLALASGVEQRSLDKIADWGKGKFGSREAVSLGEAGPQVAAASRQLAGELDLLGRLSPGHLTTARRVLAPLHEEVLARMRASGTATFQALLVEAHDLLVANPWICDQVRRDMDQLLVDEFQDTDRLQCEVVRLLGLEGPAEGRPGLFIVGDPKQSIYGWRDADLEAYDGFVRAVVAAGGTRSRLVVSYRSVPAILDEVGRVVAPVMVEERGLQPRFEPLLPCPELEAESGFVAQGRAPVEHWISWSPEGDGQGRSAAELEALAVANDMVELHRLGNVRWDEMAVLLRATGDLDVVLGALQAAGIPYVVTRDRQYFQRREIVEAAAVVRCVLDPTDQLALLTALRSDVVGVPDAALVPLWQEGFAEHMLRLQDPERRQLGQLRQVIRRAAGQVPAGVPGIERLPTWPAALEAAVAAVARLRQSIRSESTDVFVERLRSLWLGEATAAARYLGRYRQRRVESFHAELEEVLSAGGSRSEVARFLRRAVERRAESREPATPEASSDAVQVMTIHGAKGLDFEHVYVLQLHRDERARRQKRQTRVVRWGGGFEYQLLGWSTPGFMRAQLRAEQVEAAERVRLLYVSMTRAKRRLVLAGDWPQATGAAPQPVRARSLLNLVVHRGSPEQLAEQDAARRPRAVDGFGVQWVLPGRLWTEPPPAPPATQTRLPAAGTVRRHAEGLGRDREAAARRMSRPLVEAASAEAHRLLEQELKAEQLAAERGGGREVATAVGTAVHRLLEGLDLGGDLAAQVAAQRPTLIDRIGEEVAPGQTAAARQRLGELLDVLAPGACLRRLHGIAGQVLARELALLLPPAGGRSAVGYRAGSIDLLYRDPASGELVVADYKTDLDLDARALARRAAAYAAQTRVYARGLQQALGLTALPTMELWFLHADRIVQVGA